MGDLSNLTKAIEKIGEVQQEQNTNIEEKFSSVMERVEELEAKSTIPGVQGKSVGQAELKAFGEFLRTGESKEMSINGGASAGGAMVPEVIADQIVNRAIAKSRLSSIVRNTVSPSGDYVRLMNLRGATASWSAETETRSGTSTPELREVRPTSGELYSLPTITRWLAEDSQFDVARFVADNVADTFSKSIENAILLGDGSNKPTGILNTTPVATDDGASPQRDADAIEYIAGTTELADDIISLFFSVKPEYRPNGMWLMSSATLATVRKLRDANGSGFLWQESLGQSIDAPDGTLLGRPVVLSEYMPAEGESPANFPIAFGDFDLAYELVRLGPMTMIRDDITTKGKISYYTAQRFAGRLVDNDAIKVLQT